MNHDALRQYLQLQTNEWQSVQLDFRAVTWMRLSACREMVSVQVINRSRSRRQL